MAPPPQLPPSFSSRRTKKQKYAPLSLTHHADDQEDVHANEICRHDTTFEDGEGIVILRREGDVIIHEQCPREENDNENDDDEKPHDTQRTSKAPRSAAYLYAFCAALNSCNLGYDLGVSTNVGPLLQQEFVDLTNEQLELFLGSLNFWSIFGALLSPWLTDRFGRRATFAVAALAFCVGCTVMATSSSFHILMFGRCFVGLGVGVGEAIDPMYIAEIAPQEKRGYLVSWAEAGVAVGVVLGFSSSLLMYALGLDNSPNQWRIMLAMGSVLPIIMLILLTFGVIPESPRWLLAKDREDEARTVLETIYPSVKDDHAEKETNVNVDNIVGDIQASLALEQEAAQSVGWHAILCRPSPAVRRMLAVGVGMSIIQQAVGIDSIMFYLMYVIQESGIKSEVGQITALMVLGTVKLAFVIVGATLFDRLGRRPLLLFSLVGCAASLIFVSFMFASDSDWSKIMTVVGLAFYLAFFSTGLGPGNWVVVSEIFATSIRAKAMSVAVLPNRITATIMASTFLSLAKALTWPGFFLVLAGICLTSAVFLFVFLPETKGRSLEEMSLYFAQITGDEQFLEAERNLGHHSYDHQHSSQTMPSDDGENNGSNQSSSDFDSNEISGRQFSRASSHPRVPMTIPIVLLSLCGSLVTSSALMPSHRAILERPPCKNSARATQAHFLRHARESLGVINTTSEETRLSLDKVDEYLREQLPTEAFNCLVQLYAINPSLNGLRSRFAKCLQLKINLLEEDLRAILVTQASGSAIDQENMFSLRANLAQERMGMAALLIEQHRYEGAAVQLRDIVASTSDSMLVAKSEYQRVYDKACSMLFRTNAALCQWNDIDRDSKVLAASVIKHQQQPHTKFKTAPPLHPFEALKWPCISLEQSTYVAQQYADRRMGFASVGPRLSRNVVQTSREPPACVIIDVDNAGSQTTQATNRFRIGYLSPDFTAEHPLAFLMADVFRFHNRKRWEVFLYSLKGGSDKDIASPHVRTIREGADHWIQLEEDQTTNLASRIKEDNLDIMIDLCGHSGTSMVIELMAERLAPVQASYMGFPGSIGAPSFIDYLICDAIVVPYQQPQIRQHYLERLLLLPDCYFVNSHVYAVEREIAMKRDTKLTEISRDRYFLPSDAFVLCCHSRPDKIDPRTFRSWCKVLARLQSEGARPTVLWLLRSGSEMENNLRKLAKEEFALDQDIIIMADVAPRDEHLQRLALADLFLDTPAYNAHTVGCDALFAGVPMVTLLRPLEDSVKPSSQPPWERVPTDKWASRVGASLLKAVGLPDLIAPNMEAYEDLLHKAATDPQWSDSLKRRLQSTISDCPLFDLAGWVHNLETGLAEAVSRSKHSKPPIDIALVHGKGEED